METLQHTSIPVKSQKLETTDRQQITLKSLVQSRITTISESPAWAFTKDTILMGLDNHQTSLKTLLEQTST
jgi:hypothetical protein